MIIVNTTPQAVQVQRAKGGEIMTFPPCLDAQMRCDGASASFVDEGSVEGCAIVEAYSLVGFPDAIATADVLIVDPTVAAYADAIRAFAGRDVFILVPDYGPSAVRDEKKQIKYATRFLKY